MRAHWKLLSVLALVGLVFVWVQLLNSVGTLRTEQEATTLQLEGQPEEPLLRAKSGLRIVVLLAYWPSQWWANKTAEEKEMVMTNRECYCRMHNYNLVVGGDDAIPVDHGYWAKLAHTHRVMQNPHVDWIFFGDVDFFITQFETPLEHFIPDSEEYHIVLPQEHAHKRQFSNFNYLIRNSPEGRRFIRYWLQEKESLCNLKWPDQLSMFRSILRVIDYHKGTNCELNQNQCCRAVCHSADDQADCFGDSMNRMGCGAGIACPPVHFTGHLTGLGLQTHEKIVTWTPDSLHTTFGVHCKQSYPVCRAYKRTFKKHPNGTCSVEPWL